MSKFIDYIKRKQYSHFQELPETINEELTILFEDNTPDSIYRCFALLKPCNKTNDIAFDIQFLTGENQGLVFSKIYPMILNGTKLTKASKRDIEDKHTNMYFNISNFKSMPISSDTLMKIYNGQIQNREEVPITKIYRIADDLNKEL